MSLLDAILGRVTEVKSAKDGADLKIHVSKGNMPDDVITWKDKYVVVRDQEKVDRPKLPIEEEAEKSDAEHFEGMNPPPDPIPELPWSREMTFTQIENPDEEMAEGYEALCKDCIEPLEDITEVYFVVPGIGVCGGCGAEDRRLYIIGDRLADLEEEEPDDNPNDIPL